MKVVHVVPGLTADGPSSGLVDLAAAAPGAGMEIAVVALTGTADRRTGTALRAAGADVVELDLPPWDPRAVPRATRALRDLGAHLVHTHLRHADVVGAAAATGARLPVVSTLHRIEDLAADRLDRLRRTAKILVRQRFVARTVAVSRVQRDRYRRLAGSGRNLVLVPRGITDPGPVTAAVRERLRAATGVGDGVLVVAAAPIRRGEGHDLLLDAVAALPPDLDLTVVLAGDGPLRPWLASRIADDDTLAQTVRLDPRPGDVPALLGSADLALHTARSDTGSVRLLQALAAGVPVVASNVGGIPEVVTADTGVVVSRNAERIASVVADLLTDPARRERLGRGARARFLAEFEAGVWARRLAGVYASVLAER